ncbi:MAG: hypothetical protein CBB97_16630 [Candidatus Endolissoclinum sp. TMED37]|nr:MAG: hypothetical protein CBB97_16630 [Candidatus Endolissoclinum sp. TMED37]
MNLKILHELDRILKNNPSLQANKHAYCQVVNGVFDIELKQINDIEIHALAEQIDRAVLKNYFSKVWQPETKKFKYSGLAIIDEVNAMSPDNVIDIGCGYNEFKGKIKNLIGIDPYNDRADIDVHTLDYKPDIQFDVAICLGSINFGSSDKVLAELENVVNMVKSGGMLYFRVNPGIQHDKPEAKWINFYDWDPVFISNAAQHLNCDVLTLRQDDNKRFYFVLRKK